MGPSPGPSPALRWAKCPGTHTPTSPALSRFCASPRTTWAALGNHTIPLLRRWDQTRPGTPLEPLRIDDHTAGLTQGKVDAAMLRGAVTTAGLRTEPLLSEERVVVMPAGSPLAALPRITLVDLAAHPIALNTVSGATTMDLWP
ncbi:LysR substrate-binding domain-containing protein [Streptomyces sp. NPDC050988]|uniref:LysR substrate-binding domain-containing protein n=1 Tax=Streptomyces sp. NPDC050988 TaxID=3365637 RepID=UPI00378D51E4